MKERPEPLEAQLYQHRASFTCLSELQTDDWLFLCSCLLYCHLIWWEWMHCIVYCVQKRLPVSHRTLLVAIKQRFARLLLMHSVRSLYATIIVKTGVHVKAKLLSNTHDGGKRRNIYIYVAPLFSFGIVAGLEIKRNLEVRKNNKDDDYVVRFIGFT